MNTKDKGNITEAKALYEFLKRGIPVAIPFGDNERYDQIIDVGGKLYKVQSKTSNEESYGSIKCYTRSSDNHCCKQKGLRDYQGQVDFFVFYSQKRDEIALVPASVVGNKKSISLRFIEPKNNQKNVKYFSDYSFDKILPCVETLHDEPKS